MSKTLKKLLASALAATMLFSTAVTAFADSTTKTLSGSVTAGTVEAESGATTVKVPVTIALKEKDATTDGVVAPQVMFDMTIEGGTINAEETYKLYPVSTSTYWIEAINGNTVIVETDIEDTAVYANVTVEIVVDFATTPSCATAVAVDIDNLQATNYDEADWTDVSAVDGSITVKHTEEEIPAVDATCTETGLTAGTKCSVCQTVITAQEEIPATGEHIWDDGVPNPDSTCSEAGTMLYTCTVCGTATKEEAIEVKDHTPGTPVDNGDGTHTVSCSVCPAEIETVGHTYVDGTCACGATETVELNINGVSRAKTLSLMDVIYVKATVAFVEVKDEKNYNATAVDKSYILENGKILFWDANPGDNAVIGTETAVSSLEDADTYKDSSTDAEKIQEYRGISMGIPAKMFGDTIYYRTYIVIDGKEYYGDIVEYSVQTYCINQINKSATADTLKALCATMLNFGSAAQIQLKYNTDNLSNVVLSDLVDSGNLDAKYLEQNWDESLLVAANTPAENMIVNFAVNNAAITAKTLALEGAIEPKITMGYKLDGNKATELPDDADLTFYFWTSEKYETLAAAGTPLSKDNAEYTRSFADGEVEARAYSTTYGYEYLAKPEAIPARQLDQTFYFVAIVTEADGTEYCTGVNSYSPIQYAINQLAKATTSSNANLQDLCRWMVLYWEAAKAQLG